MLFFADLSLTVSPERGEGSKHGPKNITQKKSPRVATRGLGEAKRVGCVKRTIHFYFLRRQISEAISPPSSNISVPGSGTTTLAVNTPGTPAMV